MQSQRELGIHLIAVRALDSRQDVQLRRRAFCRVEWLLLSTPRERERLDIRDVFTSDLDLPRGPERQRVWARDSDVRLRGSEVRTLATVGAFRVVLAGDLRDSQDRPLDPNRGDLRHLRDQFCRSAIAASRTVMEGPIEHPRRFIAGPSRTSYRSTTVMSSFPSAHRVRGPRRRAPDPRIIEELLR